MWKVYVFLMRQKQTELFNLWRGEYDKLKEPLDEKQKLDKARLQGALNLLAAMTQTIDKDIERMILNERANTTASDESGPKTV